MYPNSELFRGLTLAILARIILKGSFSKNTIRCQPSFCLSANMESDWEKDNNQNKTPHEVQVTKKT